MPSSPLSLRPVLAALWAVLLLTSSALVSGPATLLPAAHAEVGGTLASPPMAPPSPAEDAPVSMDLVSLTPTSLAPGGMLEAQVEVTNTSSQPLPELALELRTRTARVTDRAMLSQWQANTAAEPRGAALASSGVIEELEPGQSVRLTVEIAADELGYSEASYFWGTRRIALTVASEEAPLATLRSFVVWRPAGVEDTITQSVLLPLAADDASAMIADPEAFAASVEHGRLASVRGLASRPEVDWWLDPALLDPPQMPVETAPEGGEEGDGEETPATSPEFQPEPHSAEIAQLLEESAGERTVLAMPYARSDRLSLQAAGTDELAALVSEAGDQVWEGSSLTPAAYALEVDAAAADGEALASVRAAGGTAAILPSSSLRADPASPVTPSSIGVHPAAGPGEEPLPLLAPDPELSAEFSLLTGGTDTEQIRQRLLAETATIASEYTTAPRHLLISPSAGTVLDPAATGTVLDALGAAPWITQARTGDLLDAAAEESLTTDPLDESGALYSLGEVDSAAVHPSGPTEAGRWEVLGGTTSPQLLERSTLVELETALAQVDALATAMEDDAPLDAPLREIIAGTSIAWRGQPHIPAERAQHASSLATSLQDRIEVVPASGYNVISDKVSVPITISNSLDTPITVRVSVTSDRPLVKVGEPEVLVVPAHGQADASVDVEAIANGTVTLTTTVTTEDGRPLTAPVDVPLTVNPSWENWTTLVLVIAMGLLVVVGVARARRVGSSTRAPGVRGPEDPEELARTGRSTPAHDAGTETQTEAQTQAATEIQAEEEHR